MNSETRTGIHCKAVDAFEAKNSGVVFDCYMDMEQEAKRLRAVNAELLEALRDIEHGVSCFGTVGLRGEKMLRDLVAKYADEAAIAKAEGKGE